MTIEVRVNGLRISLPPGWVRDKSRRRQWAFEQTSGGSYCEIVVDPVYQYRAQPSSSEEMLRRAMIRAAMEYDLAAPLATQCKDKPIAYATVLFVDGQTCYRIMEMASRVRFATVIFTGSRTRISTAQKDSQAVLRSICSALEREETGGKRGRKKNAARKRARTDDGAQTATPSGPPSSCAK